jgi:hypothetical protein
MELTEYENKMLESVRLLNDKGKFLAVQHCFVLAQEKIYQNKEAIDEFQKETGITVKRDEKDRDERLCQYHKDHVEGDLQLEGYILLGWYQGRKGEVCNSNWEKEKKYGLISERGLVAYLPKSGARWVYIYKTHARYAPHPDPMWDNKRWTYFAQTDEKPKRKPLKEMLHLFSQTKPDSYKERYPQNAWILSVPLWLLDEKQDMRPLYLAGGKPE